MKNRIFPLILTFAASSGAALAAPRTAMLDVQNMSCAVCPITVKKALERIAGVRQVTVDYADKTATVQFDDALTSTDHLTKATKAAGYPATIIKEGK